MIKTLSILLVLIASTTILQSADNCAATERMRQQDLRKMQDEQLKERDNKRRHQYDDRPQYYDRGFNKPPLCQNVRIIQQVPNGSRRPNN